MTQLETQVLEKLKALPLDKQYEVLTFVEFLINRSQTIQSAESKAASDRPSEIEFWQQASQPSLNAVWDNSEDDIYAQLL